MSAPGADPLPPGALTRADVLRLGAAGALALAVPSPGAAAAEDSDWPLTAGDRRAHRFSPDRIGGLHERWRVELPGGAPGTPALVGGRAYATSLGGAVVAVRLSDGRALWRRRFPTRRYGENHYGFFTGPAVAGDRVVVASDRVRCLERRTGRTLWVGRRVGEPTEDIYFWGAPVIAAGLVLVGSGSGSESARARGRVSAYALADGRLRWSTPMVPRGANGGGVLAPVSVDLARGAVWAATGSPYRTLPGDNPGTCALVELSLRDGRVRWMDQVHPADRRGLDFNSAPLLLGRLAVATSKDGVYAWDRLARRRLWRRQLTPPSARPGRPAGPQDGPEGGPIATDGRRIYVLSNDAGAEKFTVAALRPSDGRVIWRRSLAGSVFAAPACAGRTLVVASAFGPIYEMDGATGRGLDDGTLAEATACAPAVARGLVLAGTGAGRFLPGSSLVALGRILPTSG